MKCCICQERGGEIVPVMRAFQAWPSLWVHAGCADQLQRDAREAIELEEDVWTS